MPGAGYVLDPVLAGKIQYSFLVCGGGGTRERERSVSCSRAQPQAEGGWSRELPTSAVPGSLLQLSRELSLLHSMYVGRNTLICQNMLDIVRCSLLFSLKKM